MQNSHDMEKSSEQDMHLTAGHLNDMMSMQDPENPMNWPLHRKIYVSTVAWAFSFVVAFGATVYTAGIHGVVTQFDVSMTVAILGLSLYLIGIAFAPITTPHLSEAFGRSTVYMISLPLFSLFIIGSGASTNFASLAICRFFAGFFGGPCLVLIEGTFSDVWSANVTGSYYAILALSSYIGTGCGPLIGGFVFAAKDWRWTQWVTLMLTLAAYLLGIGMPETYPRAIMRRRAKLNGQSAQLMDAASGVTLGAMLQITLFTPMKMLLAEPIVALITLYLGFNFAVIFSFFISVPAVLEGVYGFEVQHVGIAFVAAIVGALLAASTCIIIDRLTWPKQIGKSTNGMVAVEYRLYPAMIGGFLITASLFWIGWTAGTVSWPSPVLGTMLYVWGNLMVLISLISYLFEAYPPRGTLSALTTAASLRLLLAAFLPLVIIQMFTGLTGAWALSLLGFINAALIPVPWIIFKWGAKLRSKSAYSCEGMGLEQVSTGQTDLERQTVGPKF